MIRFLSTWVFMISILLLTACNGETLVNSTRTNPNSSNNTAPTLTISVIHHGTPDNDSHYPDYFNGIDAKTFQNNLAITITLEKAGLSWGHAYLISEGNDPECEPGYNFELHLEHIENILDTDLTELLLTSSKITDIAYCQYRLEFSPENLASPGLSALPEITGNSAYVAGTWDDGVITGSFEIAIEEKIEAEATFQASHDNEIIDHPFHFHTGQISRTLIFRSIYDRWFDDIDFSESEEEIKSALIINIINSAGQYLENQH